MTVTIPAPFTRYNDTPNKSVRQNVARKGVVLHHGVIKDIDALRYLEMGAKQVSSSAITKDEQNESMFDQGGNWRAWSLSDAWGDSSFRSVETCNETLAPDYSISDASHWTLARNVAWWAQRDGFWPHRTGDPKTWTVIGHKEYFIIYAGSYATACPGGVNLDLVTQRAQDLLNGATQEPPKGTDMTQYWNYGNAAPGTKMIFAADPTRLVGRYLAEWEIAYLENDVKAGRTQLATLGEPQWTATIGKYRDIGQKPEPVPGPIDAAVLAKLVNDAVAAAIKANPVQVDLSDVPTAAENGAAARAAIVK